MGNELYLDRTLPPEKRAEDLLARLSIDEKMAQISCIFPGFGTSWEQDQADCTNGIGQISTLSLREMKTLEEAAAWQQQYQRMVMENSPHMLPGVQ